MFRDNLTFLWPYQPFFPQLRRCVAPIFHGRRCPFLADFIGSAIHAASQVSTHRYVACVRLVILLRNPFKWNDLDLTPGLHFRYLILRCPTHSPHKLWTSWKVLFAIAQQLWHRLYLQSHNDAVSSHSTNDFPHPSLILAHSNFQMTKKCNESTFRISCAFRRMTKCGERSQTRNAIQLRVFQITDSTNSKNLR